VAGSGEEALAVFLQDPARIRALITDLDMPGISGLQLASMIRETSPAVKILIISGSTSAPVQTMMKRIDNLVFLRKPFTGNQFVAEVKTLLQSDANANGPPDCPS
jgi:DNA-binding response OmpR family regulator